MDLPQAHASRSLVPLLVNWAISCRLKRVARMLKNHLPAVLKYFTQRVSTAVSEGINNAIGRCVHKAYGYRNCERFKTDMLFHLGELDMHPRFAQQKSHGKSRRTV